ncbi:MAG: GDYXXLXY domain-containing protein [Candidatus Thiodiazotropha sp.]
MKRILLIAAIAFQILAVAALAISREWIVKTGREMTFQTAPIDPRDIFRGDYVRLEYLFSNVSSHQFDNQIIQTGIKKGTKVYLSLQTGDNGISWGSRLSLRPPEQIPYLAGRVIESWPYKGYEEEFHSKLLMDELLQQPIQVKYGIEQYYVEQGSGRLMEEIRGTRSSYQVPLLIDTAVSGSGTAVIKSYHWANIAMMTEIVRSPERNAPPERSGAMIRFSLRNISDRSVTLPWKSGNCAFALQPVQSVPLETENLGLDRPACTEASRGSRILKPGQGISVVFNLNNPEWYVEYNGKPTPMGRLPLSYRFRITYMDEKVEGVNARIRSRSFHGRGSID